jgi:hypothetical protein
MSDNNSSAIDLFRFAQVKLNITISVRRCVPGLMIAFTAATAAPQALRAQEPSADSLSRTPALSDSLKSGRGKFYGKMAAGIATSVLLHEAGHVAASYMMGFHPTFGFSKGRPTIFSGIPTGTEHHKQFLFSAAGMTVQDLLDELILDIPHVRGGAFERGLLAGGIGTTLFYITIGRNAGVSDVTVMARNSSLSKGQVSLIFGSVAALQTIRIGRDRHYSHFFVAPAERGGLNAGMSIRTH